MTCGCRRSIGRQRGHRIDRSGAAAEGPAVAEPEGFRREGLAQRYRSHLGRSVARCFEQVDNLSMPTLPLTATTFGTTSIDLGDTQASLFGALLRNCEPFNLTGLPALSVPCGFAAGLSPKARAALQVRC